MMNQSKPLRVSITSGIIDTGGIKPTPFPILVPDYQGEQLYCKTSNSGSTLVILIDDVGPDAFNANKEATSASVTVTYQTKTVASAVQLESKYPGTPLELAIQMSADLSSATLAIRPKAGPRPFDAQSSRPSPSTASAASAGIDAPTPSGVADDEVGTNNRKDVDLGYIAIEVDGVQGTVELIYLNPKIQITNFARLTKAMIIPPYFPPSKPTEPGSIGGPMGIELTS